MASIDLLYFGSIRERLGRDVERIDPPTHVQTVSDLADLLCARGGIYAEVLGEKDRIRAAIDRQHCDLGESFFGAREVALFPPVGAA